MPRVKLTPTPKQRTQATRNDGAISKVKRTRTKTKLITLDSIPKPKKTEQQPTVLTELEKTVSDLKKHQEATDNKLEGLLNDHKNSTDASTKAFQDLKLTLNAINERLTDKHEFETNECSNVALATSSEAVVSNNWSDKAPWPEMDASLDVNFPGSGAMGRQGPISDSYSPIPVYLRSTLKDIMTASLTPSSRIHYERVWFKFVAFSKILGIKPSLPIGVPSILLFIAFQTHNVIAPRTIISQVSILGHFHKLHNLANPSQSFIVAKALAGMKNISHFKSDSRLPITIPILERLIQAASIAILSPHESKLIAAMMTLAFKAFLRIGEMVPRSESSGAENCIALNDLQISGEKIIINFRRFKHSGKQGSQSVTFEGDIIKGSNIRPIKILNTYLALRGNLPGLFFILHGKPYPRHKFDSRLKQLLKFCSLDIQSFKSHSFRIGAATYFASLGKSDAQIRAAGRWSSDAFKAYIRLT